MRGKFFIASGLGLIASAAFGGETPLTTVRVANGLSRPVFVTHAAGDYNRVFIVEQRQTNTGRIRILNIPSHTLEATPFLSISPLATGNEEGLLGLALHPNYLNNGYFWVYYTNTAGNNVIVRYRANPPFATSMTADAGSATTVMTVTHQPNTNHNGGWIGFVPGATDGNLYVAVGDGGSANDPPNNAQALTTPLGKILRIDVDGEDNEPGNDDDDGVIGGTELPYTSPPENPFAGLEGLDEIWAYGLRNPWRNSFDRETGDLWIADVGQNNWEELNYQASSSAGGENYGWRCMEGNNCTGLSGCACDVGCGGGLLVCPVFEFDHATDGFSCSVTGGYVYRGCAMPEMRGLYFFADFCSDHIKTFRYSRETGVTELTDRTVELDPPGAQAITQPSSFGEDALGELYVCDLAGEVFKIVPAAAVTPDCNGNGRRDSCDVLAGTSADCNGDGVPDECQGELSPRITEQPRSLRLCGGEGVSFFVTAAGIAPLAYQWRRNGANIAGATAATYTIASATGADAGVYDVVVSNVCGEEESEGATLHVLAGCDTNCDGTVNSFDIQGFVGLLSQLPPAACSGCAGDANENGTLNTFDIQPFLECLR